MTKPLDWKPFVYGGIASVVAESCTFPIDTTKIRLQVQGQKIGNHAVKYSGMVHAIWKISCEEGSRALYSGLSAALLRQATYGTLKIGIYHSLKKLYLKNHTEERLAVNVLCGATAGVVSAAVFNPTDLLKVRKQAAGLQPGNSRAMIDIFREIYVTEGVHGLWRGVCPTAQRAAIVVGAELPAYDFIKHFILVRGLMQDDKYLHFTVSVLAGILGAMASNPFDVVKTRMMNQRKLLVLEPSPSPLRAVTPLVHAHTVAVHASTSTHAPSVVYSGALDCLQQTVRHEGVRALWKGFFPNWLRLGPFAIVFFMTYEQLKLRFGDHPPHQIVLCETEGLE